MARDRAGHRTLLFALCLVICALSVAGLVLTVTAGSEATEHAPADLAVTVSVVPEVMTAVHKCYGSQMGFLAITEIKNNGEEPVTGFHIEYSVPGYAEDAGQYDWPVILPGATVKDYCLAKFDGQKMRELRSETGAQLDVTYTFDGCGGPRGTSSDFTFLPHNEMVWSYIPLEEMRTFEDSCSNAPTLAAFVTRDDPEVQRLAKRLTAGISTSGDREVLEAAAAVYTGLRDMRFRYVSEPFMAGSYSQTVQLPAETIDVNGGNCADLAVLFSALLESVNVATFICLSDDHVLPAIVLPDSGMFVVIEGTAVDDPEVSFEEAVTAGEAYRQQSISKGMWYELYVREWWDVGMVPSW